jgi:hypothetical protein
MKLRVSVLVWLILLPGLATSQTGRLQLNFLDHLAKKAEEAVDVNMPAALLKLANWVLDPKDPDQARARKLIAGVQGVFVKSFEFKEDGDYSESDLESIRKQLTGDWSCVVKVRGRQDNVDVCLAQKDGKTLGLAIIAAEPRELTVVNIVGNISLEDLDAFESLGVPKIKIDPKALERKKPAKDKNF